MIIDKVTNKTGKEREHGILLYFCFVAADLKEASRNLKKQRDGVSRDMFLASTWKGHHHTPAFWTCVCNDCVSSHYIQTDVGPDFGF